MVEDVEEIAKDGRLVPRLLEDLLRVRHRERAKASRRRHPEEGDRQPRRTARLRRRLDAHDIGSRKRKAHVRKEAHGLALRIGVMAHAGALRRQRVEQTHRLEELEADGLRLQPILQRTCTSPARGGHRFSVPCPWRSRATVWVNELIDV